MSREKPHISVVVVGHVDSGKSTTTGHLVYKCGGVDDRTIQKFEKEATEMGRASFKYAWVLDKTVSERSRGITIQQTTTKCETERNTITLIDAPGHRDFIKNLITGSSSADASICCVPATQGEYEVALGKDGCCLDQARLVFAIGASAYILIAINKMDAVAYSEKRFKEIETFMRDALKKIGYKPDVIAAIPISGLVGDNLVTKSDNMPWYKGWSCSFKHAVKGAVVIKGHTVVDWLDCLIPPKRNETAPLRGSITAGMNIPGIGYIGCTRIDQGTCSVGTTLTFAPCMLSAEVKSIEMHHVQLKQALPGDSVGLNLKNISLRDLKNGNIFGDSKREPPLPTKSLVVQLMVGELPGKNKKINIGYSPVMDIHCTHVPVRLSKIFYLLDKKTLKPVVRDDDEDIVELKTGDLAKVELIPMGPLACETFAFCSHMGRFAFRDSHSTVAYGIVLEVGKADAPIAKAGTKAAKGGAKVAVKGKK